MAACEAAAAKALAHSAAAGIADGSDLTSIQQNMAVHEAAAAQQSHAAAEERACRTTAVKT